MADAAPAGTLSQRGDELVEVSVGTLGHDLDAAVGQVGDPANEAEAEASRWTNQRKPTPWT